MPPHLNPLPAWERKVKAKNSLCRGEEIIRILLSGAGNN